MWAADWLEPKQTAYTAEVTPGVGTNLFARQLQVLPGKQKKKKKTPRRVPYMAGLEKLDLGRGGECQKNSGNCRRNSAR